MLFNTERLIITPCTEDDAPFICELVNENDFIQNIGDKEVRSVEDAKRFIREKFLPGYQSDGISMYLVKQRTDDAPVGICGLVDRDGLDDVDIGFAFSEKFYGKGYATESAKGMLAHANETLGLKRIVAITHPDNDASGNVLQKIGLQYEGLINLPAYPEPSKYYVQK